MAVCHDPAGAQFEVWEPKRMPGTDVDGALHGAQSWFETLTSDRQRGASILPRTVRLDTGGDADADEAALVATALEGKLVVKLHDPPRVGRSCGIVSPHSVAFRVIQYKRL